MGWIYIIWFINGKHKYYAGQTINDINARIEGHIRDAINGVDSCPLLARAIRKYTPESLKYDYWYCENHHLDFFESLFIQIYNSLEPGGYNLTSGGQKGQVFSQHVRDKMSESHRKSVDPEYPLKPYLANYKKKDIVGFRVIKPGCEPVIIADKTSPMKTKYEEALRVYEMTAEQIADYNKIRKAEPNKKHKKPDDEGYPLRLYLVKYKDTGFGVRLPHKHPKYFNDQTKPENYRNAITYLETNI